MIITLTILIILIIVFIAGRINLSNQFKKEVKTLFAQSKDISTQKFYYQQLTSLPEPVQKYFKLVLKDEQSYISYVGIKHDGQFKTGLDKGWVNITGEQYFTTDKPGFIWKGVTSMFTARDMFIEDKGRLIVSLFSLYNIVDVKGEQYNQGELLRWLAESVWFPTNLLPGERVQWFPVDAQTAKLTFNYNGLSLYFITSFNAVGEIIQMETKRYMDEKRLETWIIKAGNYKKLNGVIVPTTAEAMWRLEKGDFSYAKFNLKTIVYNNPKMF